MESVSLETGGRIEAVFSKLPRGNRGGNSQHTAQSDRACKAHYNREGMGLMGPNKNTNVYVRCDRAIGHSRRSSQNVKNG
jgi:hypothetical protein